jgi:hypothetical protein
VPDGEIFLGMSESQQMKPIVLMSPLLLAACSNPFASTYEQPTAAVIPEQFRGTWALASSACGSSKPYPYFKLEADSYRVPQAPYSKEPVRFPVQSISIDRKNERRLIATFPNPDIEGERTEIAIELSKDGKTMRWGEKGAVKIATLHRCD